MSHKQKKNKPRASAPVPVRQERLAPSPALPAAGAVAAFDEEQEPSTDTAPMPVWLFVLMIASVYWGMLHLDRYGGGFSEFVYGPYQSYKQLADLQPKS